MRRFSRILLKTALILGISGVGLSIGGIAMGATITGIDLSKYALKNSFKKAAASAWMESRDSWEEDWDEIAQLEPVQTEQDKEIFETDPTSALELSLSAGKLRFQSCDGDKIRIEVSGAKKEKVRIGTEDNSLILETTGRVQDREITVNYPKDMRFKETSIEVAAGTVTMCDKFRTDELEVSVAAGEFTNTEKISVANDITIEVGTGNVELSDLDVDNLEADCGIGNIDLDISGRETDYNYEISCAAGNIDIGGSSYSGIGHDRNITNPNARGDMELNCGVGNITVTFAE